MNKPKWYKWPALLKSALRQSSVYNLLNRTHDDPMKKLGWTSYETQEARFRVFTQIGDLNDQLLLDVGCGLGDFYGYLQRLGVSTHYTGIDIVSDFITSCQATYPVNATGSPHFEKRNILLNQPKQNFDYVFCSGIFAYGNRHFFECMVSTCFDLCTKGLAFNIHQAKSADFFKISQKEAVAFCQKLSPRHLITHNQYLPNDYTLFLYKE